MQHPFTLINISSSFFSAYMLELSIMLAGSILIGFIAGRMFFKPAEKQKETEDNVAMVDQPTIHSKSNTTLLINGRRSDPEKESAMLKKFEAKEAEWKQQLEHKSIQLSTCRQESNALREEIKALNHQSNQLYTCLKEKEIAFASIQQFKETITTKEQQLFLLQQENSQLTGQIEAYAALTVAPNQKENIINEEILLKSNELTLQLQQSQLEKQQLQQVVDDLQQQLNVIQATAAMPLPAEVTEQDTEPMMQLMQEKMQSLQAERNQMMAQIAQLENQLKITNLSLLSNVEINQEEENPIKRLTLYLRMLEGEKQGLNNKIADLTKKLGATEAGVEQIQEREHELSYLKARIAAMEQDKKDAENESGKWEVMYKKLQEKLHYLLSSKDTDLEQQKTMISYLEKDKTRLQGRINILENELRSSLYNYKGQNPLAFNV
jgi:chromosome segregation ATPase